MKKDNGGLVVSDKVKKFIEIVEKKTGTSTFCVLPWIHVATRPNGDARLCCGSNASQATNGIMDAGLVKKEDGIPANFGKETLQSAWNNKYMRTVRTTMLDGNIPSSCSKCFEEESKGIDGFIDNEPVSIKASVCGKPTTGTKKAPTLHS